MTRPVYVLFAKVFYSPSARETLVPLGLWPGCEMPQEGSGARFWWLSNEMSEIAPHPSPSPLLLMLMDELLRLIETDPTFKAMVPPAAAYIIPDLAIMCECLHQLDLCRFSSIYRIDRADCVLSRSDMFES